MLEAINNIMAISNKLYKGLSITFAVIAAVCALFVLVVILMQPSNSEGISALGGSSDTFYGKNKGKTIEHKLKVLTGICLVIIACFMVGYYILELVK